MARQARSQRTVESILTAAGQLLVRTGRPPTTNHIAARAGVGIGSLYEYFRSKEEILAELQRRHVNSVRAQMQDELGRVIGRALPDATRSLVRMLIRAHAFAPDLDRLLTEHASQVTSMGYPEVFGQQLVAAYLRKRGRVRPDRLALASLLIAQTVQSLTQLATERAPGLFEDPAFVEEVAQLVMGYALHLERTPKAPRTSSTRARA